MRNKMTDMPSVYYKRKFIGINDSTFEGFDE